MSKSIVFKLFLLTMGLCLLVIASIFVGQTVFFKHFYVQQKVDKVTDALHTYRQSELMDAPDAQTSWLQEQAFYEETNAWVAVLDEKGYLKHTDDFELELRLEPSDTSKAFAKETVTVPLYTMMDVERANEESAFFPDYLGEGKQLALEGIVIDGDLYPQRMNRNSGSLRQENHLENKWLVSKEFEVLQRFANPTHYWERYPNVLSYGEVTQIRLPKGEQAARYTNRIFLDRVRVFQGNLLYGDLEANERLVTDYQENGVDYKIFVERVSDPSGKPVYLFAMTSLQPVHEAMEIMQSFYMYIVAGALLLVVLASLYFSRRIAAPLLRIDKVTQRMATLDFSGKIPIQTEDEIGNLSRNINRLSEMVKEHIDRLEQDIEKERRLEETRKQFISGVSHELKTPLSVLESCLYILKDKPDSAKREYYFTAMEEEVGHMVLLVDDMLELARYESGTYKLELEAVGIEEVVERVCAKLAPDIAVKQLDLLTRITPAKVYANRSRLEQVVVNFMTNAIRYTPERHAIIVKTVETEDAVKLTMENKGTQIPLEQLEKIWDRFYRGEHSRHRSTGGTGLGLAISRQILELHGASYGAMNTEDGVLFWFQLKKAIQV